MGLIVLTAVVAFGIGVAPCACDRARKPPEPERVWTPSARDLHNSYVDASERYTNKVVNIALPAFSYVVVEGRIHWNAGNPRHAPDIVFTVSNPPADNTRHIEIEGICRGRVENKQSRPPDPKFHVLVEAWSVATH